MHPYHTSEVQKKRHPEFGVLEKQRILGRSKSKCSDDIWDRIGRLCERYITFLEGHTLSAHARVAPPRRFVFLAKNFTHLLHFQIIPHHSTSFFGKEHTSFVSSKARHQKGSLPSFKPLSRLCTSICISRSN